MLLVREAGSASVRHRRLVPTTWARSSHKPHQFLTGAGWRWDESRERETEIGETWRPVLKLPRRSSCSTLDRVHLLEEGDQKGGQEGLVTFSYCHSVGGSKVNSRSLPSPGLSLQQLCDLFLHLCVFVCERCHLGTVG